MFMCQEVVVAYFSCRLLDVLFFLVGVFVLTPTRIRMKIFEQLAS